MEYEGNVSDMSVKEVEALQLEDSVAWRLLYADEFDDKGRSGVLVHAEKKIAELEASEEAEEEVTEIVREAEEEEALEDEPLEEEEAEDEEGVWEREVHEKVQVSEHAKKFAYIPYKIPGGPSTPAHDPDA